MSLPAWKYVYFKKLTQKLFGHKYFVAEKKNENKIHEKQFELYFGKFYGGNPVLILLNAFKNYFISNIDLNASESYSAINHDYRKAINIITNN